MIHNNKILRFILSLLSDKTYIIIQYFYYFRKIPSLNNPQTFNEKIQWLKLNYRNELQKVCVDKFAVRDYVAQILGNQYLIPLVSVYNSPNEIKFDTLPNQFVLKLTHGSGWNIICKNKIEINKSKIIKKLIEWNNSDFYFIGREWAYKGIKPRIICEEYISGENGDSPYDYKFFCFNGKPKFIVVDFNRFFNHSQILYDCSWNRIPCALGYPINPEPYLKPSCFDEMISLAHSLAQPFPFVRVDLYQSNKRVYFGELTFYPAKGVQNFNPRSYDLEFGKLLRLEEISS